METFVCAASPRDAPATFSVSHHGGSGASWETEQNTGRVLRGADAHSRGEATQSRFRTVKM